MLFVLPAALSKTNFRKSVALAVDRFLGAERSFYLSILLPYITLCKFNFQFGNANLR